jgi:hypothetical protein
MGAKKWASNGMQPDWMDVLQAMSAIGAIHLGVTMVTILPLGTGSTGGMRVAITTHWDALPGTAQLSEVVTEREFVGHRDGDLAAFVLGGLYAHDFAVGEAYQQRDFGG